MFGIALLRMLWTFGCYGRSASPKPNYLFEIVAPGKLRSAGVIEIRPLRGRAASETNTTLLSITHHPSPTNYPPPTITHQLSPITHHPPTITHQLSPTNYHPPTITHHPSPINYQLSPINYHPSTITHQLSPINHHPSTITHQPSTINHQLSTINYHPPTITHHPSPTNHQPPTINHQLSPHQTINQKTRKPTLQPSCIVFSIILHQKNKNSKGYGKRNTRRMRRSRG